jgi:Uma2 family endonuclease
VFEVLSPEDSLQRLKRKLEDYRAMGIPQIWVIDPQDSTFYRYEELQLLRNDSFSHAEKGIVFDMNQIKSLLDWRTGAASAGRRMPGKWVSL